MVTVAVASFFAEYAFVSAVLPSSSFIESCKVDGFIGIPVEVPGEIMCLPAHLVNRSGLDVFVPIVCLALVLAGSACMLQALGFYY